MSFSEHCTSFSVKWEVRSEAVSEDGEGVGGWRGKEKA